MGSSALSAITLVSSNLRLGPFAEQNRLGATQVGVVRIVPVLATELVRLLANASIPLPPPRIRLAIIHTVTDGPGHGNLPG